MKDIKIALVDDKTKNNYFLCVVDLTKQQRLSNDSWLQYGIRGMTYE